MSTRLDYEWDVEVLDEYGDIVDHLFQSQFPGSQDDPLMVVVLVKSYAEGNPGDDLSFDIKDRTWAYIKDGTLPQYFDDGSKVPMHFHKEVTNRKTEGTE